MLQIQLLFMGCKDKVIAPSLLTAVALTGWFTRQTYGFMMSQRRRGIAASQTKHFHLAAAPQAFIPLCLSVVYISANWSCSNFRLYASKRSVENLTSLDAGVFAFFLD